MESIEKNLDWNSLSCCLFPSKAILASKKRVTQLKPNLDQHTNPFLKKENPEFQIQGFPFYN